jgi:signal peptidase I
VRSKNVKCSMNWKFNLKRTTRDGAPKRSKKREWLNAIVFAVVVSTLIRGLLFSAYAIPSASMEGTLLTGDYLFVSKISYGPRMPFTPLSNSFLEPTITKYHIKTYWDGIQLPYFRLPGFARIKRGDIVIFNKPEEADLSKSTPVDERTNLIKRCQALPGDLLEIRNSQVYINGKAAVNMPEAQSSYIVETDGNSINPTLFDDLKIQVLSQRDQQTFMMFIPTSSLKTLRSFSFIKKVAPYTQPAGDFDPEIFPHSGKFPWNLDNYGPLVIPAKGMPMPLNDSTMVLYRRAIEVYENNKVEIKSGEVYINGVKSKEYTFKLDYYWMMGDSRHNSLDSRYWGYVPEDHVVGKALITWMSLDPKQSLLSAIRWERIFKPIK